jgi:membrane-bound lytic murein transglycosylase F
MRHARLLVSAALLALGCSGAATRAEAADLPAIQKLGELRVLVVDGSPAFFGVRPGTPPGLEREILDGFANLHKLKVRVVEIQTWEELIPALLEDRGDVIAGGMTKTSARSKIVAFTSEVFPTRDVVLTRKPHRVVTSLQELREEKVGTIKGTSYEQFVLSVNVPRKNIDDTIPATGFGEALKSGQVTAVVDGIEDALRLQQADPMLQIGTFVGPPSSLAFAVRKGDTALLQALDMYVDNTRKSPTWSRLVVKYFGASAIDVLKRARASQ